MRAGSESAHARLRRLRACATALIRAAAAAAVAAAAEAAESSIKDHQRTARRLVLLRGKAGANRDSGRCSVALGLSWRGFIKDLSTTSQKERKEINKYPHANLNSCDHWAAQVTLHQAVKSTETAHRLFWGVFLFVYFFF